MDRTSGVFTESSGRNCRLCRKNHDYYYSIFTTNVACNIALNDAIHDLIGVHIAVGDGLPTTICPLCLKKLTEFSVFKKICLESDAVLRKSLQSNCCRFPVKEETEGQLSEGNYPPPHTSNPAGISTDASDPLAGEYLREKEDAQDTGAVAVDLEWTLIGAKKEPSLEENAQSIQGDEAADDELGSSVDTKDFIQDEIQGNSHLTSSVQTTEIYIPVSDSQQFRDNTLLTVKEEGEDPLSEGNYPEMYTPDPTAISSNALDPLATVDLSGMRTCGSPSVIADQVSDDGGGYAHNESSNGDTNDLVSVVSDQAQTSISSHGERVDAEGTGAIEIDLDSVLVLAKEELSPKETDATEHTVMENGGLIQNCTMAMESMIEAEESTAPERASAMFAVLEPKIRASHSRKGKNLMDKDVKKCDTLRAVKITSCSIPNDGRLHSKSRYAYKIGGDREITTIAGKSGGCDNADIVKFFRSTEHGNYGPETIIWENKVKSACMNKNLGNCASSTKKPYHCFKCRDVFNSKYDLIKHLKIHFSSGNLDIDSNSSICKDSLLETDVFSRETNSSCQPISSKSLNQLMGKRQGVRQRGNRLLKDDLGGTRESENVIEVRKNFVVDGKSSTVNPYAAKNYCSECGKSFSEKSNLVRHIRTHTKEKPYSCSECDKSFSQKSNADRHIRTHTKERLFSFNEFDKSLSENSQLLHHIRNKNVREVSRSFVVDGKSCFVSPRTVKKSYSCSECEKSFSEKTNLVRHIRTHTKEKPYSCNECDMSFSLQSNLVRHIRTHTKEKPYSCNECQKRFSQHGTLVSHIRTHTKEKPYSCKECDKSFSQKSTLVCHMRTHTKEKPYSCNECDKSFSMKSHLVCHIRTHTKETPYSCHECEKSFSRRGHLVSHIRTHTKEKPYSCNECDKSFSHRTTLAYHIRTHVKEKP